MKRIFALTLLAVLLAALNLACLKPAESNSNQKSGETNTNKQADEANANAKPSPSAQDESAQLLKDLTDTVHRFNTARNTGDTATQERLLANEFSARGDDGKTYNKADWIDPKGLPNFASHKVENAEVLNHTQYTATLGYDGRTTYNDGTPSGVSRYTVTFVKRDGRWQIKSVSQ